MCALHCFFCCLCIFSPCRIQQHLCFNSTSDIPDWTMHTGSTSVKYRSFFRDSAVQCSPLSQIWFVSLQLEIPRKLQKNIVDHFALWFCSIEKKMQLSLHQNYAAKITHNCSRAASHSQTRKCGFVRSRHLQRSLWCRRDGPVFILGLVSP